MLNLLTRIRRHEFKKNQNKIFFSQFFSLFCNFFFSETNRKRNVENYFIM